MSDGSRLHSSWLGALEHAQTRFRSLLGASSAGSWKRVPTPSPSRDNTTGVDAVVGKGKGKAALPRASDVKVHRRTQKGDDVLRVTLELPVEDGLGVLETWKAVLTTPELRKEWDPTVDSAHVVETCFDPDTRIVKTDYRLGWPANPRDAITISRTFTDATTLIDISTSLPRSPDEPAYLRPAPPFVRSHVHLIAWCLQLLPPTADSSSKTTPAPTRLRITCFWQHDLKALWGMANVSQNLPSVVVGLLRTVRKRGNRIPVVSGWGVGVDINALAFNDGREALRLDYSILPKEDAARSTFADQPKDLEMVKERRRLERSVEFAMSLAQGWDIQITTRASSEETSTLPWTVQAVRVSHVDSQLPSSNPGEQLEGRAPSQTGPSPPPENVIFRVKHNEPEGPAILRVKVTIELSGGAKGLRVNGSPHPIINAEPRDPSSSTPKELLGDAVSSVSRETGLTKASQSSAGTEEKSPLVPRTIGRSPATEKSILSLVRRNYIYFTSLLQEPEAKWRHVNESRGVTISQLDSIDPTLVVYRAEAVFVGIGLWDLLSIVKTPGARVFWDRGYEDAALLEDVNELTELWHQTTKSAWPVNARDNVLLSTSYKSPTAVHIFSFSTDDRKLFPTIPPVEPNVIRTQVDLQGWAIEALSPTTTLLTLLDQSDPKGWSNKSSIPQQMIATLAGVGEFAIKCGGPPIATRLGGGKLLSQKYDHEKGSFRVEYEGSENRRHSLISANDMLSAASTEPILDLTSISPRNRTAGPVRTLGIGEMPRIECELRCDLDTWATGLELVVDPPPQGVFCLKRHRLSAGGGGMWITIEYDATFVGEDRLMTVVRKGTSTSGKDRGAVIVNGVRVKVDTEELPDHEVKSLTKQKRVRPVRIPLDQPPVLGVIRRRRVEWDDENENDRAASDGSQKGSNGSKPGTPTSSTTKFTSPLNKFFTVAMEGTAAAFTPATYVAPPITPVSSADQTRFPMQQALEGLEYLRAYARQDLFVGWAVASDKAPMSVFKKMDERLSTTIPIHRAGKVIEGVSASDVATAITNYDCRKLWDDRFVSHTLLQEYGRGCSAAFVVQNSGFPFRDRGFWVASAIAHVRPGPPASPPMDGARPSSQLSTTPSTVPHPIIIASASFSPTAAEPSFSLTKVNRPVYPTGQLILSGWILEAVDPYQDIHNHPIPSVKCTHFVAVDYRGSVPVAFNNSMNAMLPRSEILGLEAWLTAKGKLGLGPLLRTPASSVAVYDAASPSQTRSSDTEDGQTTTHDGWSLSSGHHDSIAVSTGFNPNSSEFSAKVILKPVDAEGRTIPEIMMSSRPHPRRSSTVLPGGFNPGMVGGTSTLSRSFSVTGRPPSPIQMSREASASTITHRSRRASGTTTPTRPSATTHQRHPSTPSAIRSTSPSRSTTNDSSRSLLSSGGDSDADRAGAGDIVVAEITINPEAYPGGYRVQTMASLWASVEGSTEPLRIGVPLFTSRPPPTGMHFPLAAHIYTVPSSTLLSAMSDKPTARHLLRLTLPTAQYSAFPILDPLTGETTMPPTKPSWLAGLERRGVVVEIQISGVLGDIVTTKGTPRKITFNGKDVAIFSERKSVSLLGRDVLEDDGALSIPLLSRTTIPTGQPSLPSELSEPLAIETSLLEDAKDIPIATAPTTLTEEPKPMETKETAVSDPSDLPLTSASATHGNAFMNFWNTSSSFLRLTSLAPPVIVTSKDLECDPTPVVLTSEEDAGGADALITCSNPLALAHTKTQVTPPFLASQRTFRLSTVIFIALISFLFGSLLRSLLSPADFIYFTNSREDGEIVRHDSDPGHAGWREVRRLVELKHSVFGWDFVLAVVRRPRPVNL
ncbi:hypothetical protein FRB95_001154 [Tulasnella sp. JGI-2019a]|nr:hypothetical protein FRB95_001154 [Tulasnella sp. JGI-2019a]